MTTQDSSPTPPSPQSSDYNEHYYQSGLGLPYDESQPHWSDFFGDIAQHIVEDLSPRTVLDVGCAKGFLVAALADRGVDASGVDVSDYAVGAAVKGAEGRLRVQSLTEPIEGRWDLVTAIEVLEHMTPDDCQTAIDNICAITDLVLLSSTPHDFVEPSHINVRPVATWARWFAARGFFRRTDLDVSYLSPWAVVFERRQLSAPDVAYQYEVEVAPLREELIVKRAELVRAARQISDLSDRLDQLQHGASDAVTRAVVEPRFDIDRVLSLIDQVIGLQAERAEQQYRYDLALWATKEAAEEQRQELEDLATEAAERLDAILSSRSWRIGQAVMRQPARIRRILGMRRTGR